MFIGYQQTYPQQLWKRKISRLTWKIRFPPRRNRPCLNGTKVDNYGLTYWYTSVKTLFKKVSLTILHGLLMGILKVESSRQSHPQDYCFTNMGFKIYRLSSQNTRDKFGIEQYFLTDRLSSAKHSVRRSTRTENWGLCWSISIIDF